MYTSAVDGEALEGIVARFMTRTKYERNSGGVFQVMAFLFYFDIYAKICISNCTSPLFVLHFLALEEIIIIIIIIITYLLTYSPTHLLTAIEFSLGGGSPYTITDKTNKNNYT
jgi:hypothetical protein